MPEEWPIAAPPEEGRTGARVAPLAADGDQRLASVTRDFFLPAGTRLTEQERALMTAMLHGLVERIADELRARLKPDVAAACESETGDLVADLTRAGLLQETALVALLLRRADAQRLAQDVPGGRTMLQRWTASDDGEVAAAAMTLIAARGRSRDRFGRVSLDLSDLPASLAGRLVQTIAAAIGRRCRPPRDRDLADASARLLASAPEEAAPETLEVTLAEALGPSGRREPGMLTTLAREGEAPLLSAILAVEAGIPPEEGWRCLLGGWEQLALLLRLAKVSRADAAAILAAAVPGLGIGDPGRAIDRFDTLPDAAVQAAAEELSLPTDYRRARARLVAHG